MDSIINYLESVGNILVHKMICRDLLQIEWVVPNSLIVGCVGGIVEYLNICFQEERMERSKKERMNKIFEWKNFEKRDIEMKVIHTTKYSM